MSGTLKNNLFGGEDFGVLHKDINKALESVMTSSGEVSSLVYAEHLLTLIEQLNDDDLVIFLKKLELHVFACLVQNKSLRGAANRS